ncbi:alpha/beta hydrolase fold domain-containing protein [Streptomyces fractus]|uniref:alpha/beta hydrolase fold domain-containing protein n=1 Tax=Streptomyces fractus TaxID=641806 RepID=UPI003CEFE44B
MSDDTTTTGHAGITARNAAVMGRYMEGLSRAPRPPERLDPPPVRVMRDLVFSTPRTTDGGRAELRMDLYLPQGSPAPTPVVVWLPGGGWRGQRRGVGPRLTRLFAERGYAMADIEYRSSDVDRWPAQRDDVLAALGHLRAIADDHGLDAGAIGLWGSSAGGHLALLAAFSDSSAEPAAGSVRAVVAGYPPTDLAHLDDDALPGGVLGVDLSDPAWNLLGGAPASRSSAAADASPARQVHAHVPPVLLLHGDADLLIGPAQSRRLYDTLLAAGAESHLILVHGADHGFLNSGDWERCPLPGTLHSSRAPGTERPVSLSPALVERFFDRHLRTDPWNA